MTFDEITAQWRTQTPGETHRPAVMALARHLEHRQRARLAVHVTCLAITVGSLVYTLVSIARRGGAMPSEAWPALTIQFLAFWILSFGI